MQNKDIIKLTTFKKILDEIIVECQEHGFKTLFNDILDLQINYKYNQLTKLLKEESIKDILYQIPDMDGHNMTNMIMEYIKEF